VTIATVMADDVNRPVPHLDDPVHLLERAVAIAERRRRYRRALASTGFALLVTAVVLGIVLLTSG
jgi:hypothetical protein